MNRKLHLRTVPVADDHDPYDPGALVTVPLGGGLGATVHDGARPLTVGDLTTVGASASLLWQNTATGMLAVLGELSVVHGTALRHRDVGAGVREIAVIDDPFPAAGLVSHPLLALPTSRILTVGPSPTPFFVTPDQRLFISTGAVPPVDCTGPLDISAGHCQTLESVP
ncbi:hypothetical protein [Corynebacterium sp.]|uniref:hypothetical protein n=1 Tax=Corynebacterium sp. TaxID=1720 RepID=UPI003B3A3F35